MNPYYELYSLSLEELIHPDFLPLLKPFVDFGLGIFGAINDYSYATDSELFDDEFNEARNILLSQIECFGTVNPVYRFPFLSSKACNLLLKYQEELNYAPNEYESYEAQMMESILLGEAEQLHAFMQVLYNTIICPIWMVIFGTYPNLINQIQLTKYTPNQERDQCTWHYDINSECTSIIELNENPSQAGSMFRVFPDVTVPYPEIQGTLTLFRGVNALHRSTKTINKERNIVVFWTDHTED